MYYNFIIPDLACMDFIRKVKNRRCINLLCGRFLGCSTAWYFEPTFIYMGALLF